MFALKSEHVRLLQDFMVWPKCLDTETTMTEKTCDRNGWRPKRLRPKRLRSNRPEWNSQTESARPKSPVPQRNTTFISKLLLFLQKSIEWRGHEVL